MNKAPERYQLLTVWVLILALAFLSACGGGRHDLSRILCFDLDHEGFLNPEEAYGIHLGKARFPIQQHIEATAALAQIGFQHLFFT